MQELAEPFHFVVDHRELTKQFLGGGVFFFWVAAGLRVLVFFVLSELWLSLPKEFALMMAGGGGTGGSNVRRGGR